MESNATTVQANDSKAIAIFSHRRSLEAHCRRILNDALEAEDAAEEAFVKALESLASYRGEASLKTWLFRIGTRKCLDRKRARGSRPSTQTDDGQSVDCLDPTTMHWAKQSIESLHVNDVLASLTESQACALRLKLEGRSHREIAHALGCTPRQVNDVLHQGRKRFKRRYEPDAFVCCESCAQSGDYDVPATRRSRHPDVCRYDVCDQCASHYDSILDPPSGD